MRGTGCSGGAFDFFETLQGLDGYDVIETVARQPWVARHKVGMIGVSYGGISQLFVAATRPPSLAAITPLSVIDDTQTTLYPGGILNTGFALVVGEGPRRTTPSRRRRPAASRGRSSASAAATRPARPTRRCTPRRSTCSPRCAPTTTTCRRSPTRSRPTRFVQKINVPVYLACQLTDEQTGGHCPTLPRRFTGTKRKWFTFTNGVHIDSLDPATFNALVRLPRALRRAAPAAAAERDPRRRAGDLQVGDGHRRRDAAGRPDPGPADLRRRRWPRSRRCRRCGSCSTTARARRRSSPVPGFERSFERFPLPGTAARSWYLAPGGALADSAPAAAGTDTFTWSRARAAADELRRQHRGGTNGLWTATPSYQVVAEPAGHGGVLRQRAARRRHRRRRRRRARGVDQDPGAQRRPPGHGHRGPARRARRRSCRAAGCARASASSTRGRSTLLEPVLSLRKKDSAPLPKGKFAQGHRAALLPGPRLPGGLARARDAGLAARRPAGLGVRGHAAEQGHEGDGRARSRAPVAARAAGGRRARRADRPAGVPGPARRALPRRSPSRRGSSARPPRAPRRPSRAARRGARARPRT